METLVDRLQKALSAKKLSWSKASTMIGLSPQAPSKWKKGQISKETLEKLAGILEVDVGLSAILSTVTIKIDTEQFRQILLMKVSESNLPLDQKNQITSVLQELPAESIKHLSTKLLDLGWDNLGSLMQLIQNIPA